MNDLAFNTSVQRWGKNIHLKVVDIFIDGNNLIDLLKDYETPFAIKEGSQQIEGGYVGIPPKSLYVQLNRDTNKGWPQGKINIYACKDCGEEGCWPMYVKVSRNGRLVIWNNFEQPLRSKTSKQGFWNYEEFGPFIFDSEKYYKAVESICLAPFDKIKA